MKFYLLERGHSHAENTLHVFDTAEARDAKTKELIYGQDELCPDDVRGLGLYLEELRDTGNVQFEGDPGLEWFTAHPADGLTKQEIAEAAQAQRDASNPRQF